MANPNTNCQNELVTGRTGRRRFLAGLGATGLASAVTVFGTRTAAEAAGPNSNYGCCNLAHPLESYSTCATRYSYIWYCYPNKNCQPPCCDCCEDDSHNRSAYQCFAKCPC